VSKGWVQTLVSGVDGQARTVDRVYAAARSRADVTSEIAAAVITTRRCRSAPSIASGGINTITSPSERMIAPRGPTGERDLVPPAIGERTRRQFDPDNDATWVSRRRLLTRPM
jgi:hypothetical protein